MQGRWPKGVISNYEFFVSSNNVSWKPVAQGEFSNIKNNPIEQFVNFDNTKGRYIKLKAIRVVDENAENISIAELGVITH
jgi:alpha-L-fucosidase